MKTINDLHKLVKESIRAYIYLQIAADKSVSFAVLSDSTRASLRNTLSDVLNKDCQSIQEDIEEIAFDIRNNILITTESEMIDKIIG